MLAVIALLVAVSIRLSLRRFRDVAAEISQGRIGDYAFSHRNVVPELSSVARDFDKLVHDLRGVSQQIRQSAEDKAHSFKTPLAAIRSALEPVRRAVPGDNQRARRALEIVDSSLARLLDLVIAAQRHDLSTADLIETPRVPTDFTQLIGDAALHFREILASKDIRLIRRLDERAMVRAGPGMLEVVLQNVLENAISFSPRGGTIVVTLTTNARDGRAADRRRRAGRRTRQDRRTCSSATSRRARAMPATRMPSTPSMPGLASGSSSATSRHWAAGSAPPIASAVASR